MMTTSARARSRRAAAAVSSGSLALLALAAAPMTAEAVSPSISYTCSAPGLTTFVLPVVLDTSLPQRMTSGQATQVVMTAAATLPGSTAKEIVTENVGVNAVEATLASQVSLGATPATPSLAVGRTAIPDQTAETAVKLTGTSAAFPFSAPAVPGPMEITAGTITVELRYFNGPEPQGTAALTCTVPNGKPPVIDTVAVVSPTTTTLTLARSTSAFGQGVAASAKVTSPSGTPAGEVAFTVGNTVTRARVDKDGVASLVLPDMPVGTHTVVATFVPSDLSSYIGGTSVTQLLTVSKAETKVRVPVTGKRVGTVTRVGVKAKGAYDTVPTGKVKIKLKRVGKAGRWVRVRSLDGSGAARVGFGSLTVGRYRVVVKYRGDASHLAASATKAFRVTRR